LRNGVMDEEMLDAAGRERDRGVFGLEQEELGLLAGVGRLADGRLPAMAGRFLSHAAMGLRPAPDLTRLQRDLADHWRRLFQDAGSEEHAERARALGEAYDRAGLAPAACIAAYGLMLGDLLALVQDALFWRRTTAEATRGGRISSRHS